MDDHVNPLLSPLPRGIVIFRNANPHLSPYLGHYIDRCITLVYVTVLLEYYNVCIILSTFTPGGCTQKTSLFEVFINSLEA